MCIRDSISGYPASDDDSKTSWESLGIKMLAKPVEKSTLGAHINETIATAKVKRSTDLMPKIVHS